jgi:hypothetical protein
MGRGERPEHSNPPEIFYNEEEARKYTSNSRMIEIQVTYSALFRSPACHLQLKCRPRRLRRALAGAFLSLYFDVQPPATSLGGLYPSQRNINHWVWSGLLEFVTPSHAYSFSVACPSNLVLEHSHVDASVHRALPY